MDDAFERRHEMYHVEVQDIAARRSEADPACLPIALNAAGASVMFIENLTAQLLFNSKHLETELAVAISEFLVNDPPYEKAKALVSCGYIVDDVAASYPASYNELIDETTKLFPALAIEGRGLAELGPILNWKEIPNHGNLEDTEAYDEEDQEHLLRFHRKLAYEVGEQVAPNAPNLFVMSALLNNSLWFDAWNEGLDCYVGDEEE